MPGPIKSEARPCDGTVRTVEAGTMGRLLRACMSVARVEPEWLPVGPVETHSGSQGGTVFRQRMRAGLRHKTEQSSDL